MASYGHGPEKNHGQPHRRERRQTEHQAGRGGESFAAGVKALELGTLIGTRTAGAGIWLSSGNRLVDGGIARAAESPQYGLDGRWLIEGWGIAPDIEVENMPFSTYNGADAQLQAAIDFLENKIREEPIPALKAKPIPPVGIPGMDVE